MRSKSMLALCLLLLFLTACQKQTSDDPIVLQGHADPRELGRV